MPATARIEEVNVTAVDPSQLSPGDPVLGVMLAAPIGAGNAARVWSGLDGEDPVAVKVFDPALAPGASRAVFARGAAAMVRLCAAGAPPWILRARRCSGDGLALVTDIAESDAGDLVALEWPPEKIVPFFAQLCRAVAAAHRLGVVHRCLKPANIMVSDALEPLVTDFDLVDLPALAREDPFAGGYAAYAAPEELAGTGSGAPTADVYSLGRVLYFLLNGRDPDEPVADLPALFPLSGQPQGLVRIIRKCTMRDPAARYQDVAALLADLSRHERAEEVGVAGPVFDAPPASQRSPAARAVVEDSGPVSVRGGPVSTRGGPVSTRGGPVSTRGGAPPARASSPGLDEAPPASQRGAALSRRADVTPVPRGSMPSLPAITPAAPEPWLPRRAEQIAAAAGGGVAVALMAALALTAVPSPGLLAAVRYGLAAAAALLTLALPRFERRLVAARLAFAALAAVLVHQADASQLAALRLKASLTSADPAARAEAARLLALGGHRDLSGSDLSGVDLTGAELTGVSFRGANLSRANLGAAALLEVDLEGADLTDAIVSGAHLSGSNAEAATGWATVACDEVTGMPEGWACVGGHPARAPEEEEP